MPASISLPQSRSSARSQRRSNATGNLPSVSQPLLAWFRWYGRRHLRRHFHAVRLSRHSASPQAGQGSLVIYLNHASWWDPLVCLLLAAKLFPAHRSFAPMDAQALAKYPFFRRLGFFPVEQATPAGATQFLRAACHILSQDQTILWLTPQGRFADVRERPLALKGGLGHLAGRLPHVPMVPLALEYSFWEERLPEVLVRFGAPADSLEARDAHAINAELELALTRTLDDLAKESTRRDPSAFECLLRHSNIGASAPYDAWRRLRAFITGRQCQLTHGDK